MKNNTKTGKKRRVVVVTGTRSEYGLLRPVMAGIDGHEGLGLQLVVTGMHLLRRFGYTVKEIEADGWRIDARVKLQGEKDDVIGQSMGLGRAITKMSEEFYQLGSEVVLVLGDRIEAFAGAAAATASQLVLGHIHGGDVAAGVQDDAYRDAISKLAHVHFAATKAAKERLIGLGEEKFRVYQTGSPSIDNLAKIVCKDRAELSKWAGFNVGEDYVVVLQHPAGGTAKQEEKRMRQTLEGCRCKGLKILVLYPNSDAGFSGITRAIDKYASEEDIWVLKHIPRGIYLGFLKRSRALVGNSSSGIIEAGHLNVDVVNVGPRQTGRERGANVRDVDYGAAGIARELALMLRDRPATKRKAERIYGDGRSGKRIASILAKLNLDQRLRQKRIAHTRVKQ